MNKWLIRTAFCLMPAAITVAGAPGPEPDLWLTQKGEVLFSEDFSAGLDTNRWTTAKGAWSTQSGVLTGSELESDHHAAVARTEVPFENAILQFDFRLDGSKGFSLSVNEAKGHHSRAIITPDEIRLQKDKDKKDPRSLTLPLARQNCALKPGVWYTLTVEYCGNDLLAHINKQTFILGNQEQIGAPKLSFGFPVSDASASFDNITIWAATPKADLAAIKEQLLAQQAARDNTSTDPRAACSEAETRLRDQLMKSDPAFNRLVDERVAIDNEMHKRWPKAFLKNAAAQPLRQKLLDEDAEFKALNTQLAKARKAELDYLLKQSPELAELRKTMLSAQSK